MSVTPTRRERLRAASFDEIHTIARDLLVRDGVEGITLRAIGRQMGMVPSALYRYYPSLEELQHGLCVVFYEECRDHLLRVVSAIPADPATPRLFVACRAFRAWSTAHPAEFAMMFARPVGRHALPGRHPKLHAAAMGLTGVLVELFAEMWQQVNPPAGEAELPPELRAHLQTFLAEFNVPLPVGTLYAAIAAWSRLYGLIALELFGDVEVWMPDGEQMFECELAAIARQFGVDLTRERP